MQLAPVIRLRQFAAAKIRDLLPRNGATAICRLQRYAGYGNTPATAIRQLWQYAGTKIRNLLVCQLHQLAGAMF
jgi:hypothetical protein